MAEHENEQLARGFNDEVWNKGYLTRIEHYCAPEIAEQVMAAVPPLRSAFPDLHITIDELLAVNDRVVVRSTLRGTHQGAYSIGQKLIPATGKAVSLTSIAVLTIADGRIARVDEQQSWLGFFCQLDAICLQARPHRWRLLATKASGWGIVAVVLLGLTWSAWRGDADAGADDGDDRPFNYQFCQDALNRRRDATQALVTAPPAPGADGAAFLLAKAGWDEARATAREQVTAATTDIDRYCKR